MRKIDKAITDAIANRQNLKKSNTEVEANEKLISVFLHDNNIFNELRGGREIEINLCGWNTPTTRRRLNEILNLYGFSICQSCFNVIVTDNKGTKHTISENGFYKFEV